MPKASDSYNPSGNRLDLVKIKDCASVVQSTVTVLAILAAGIWFLFQGEARPRANVIHEIIDRPIDSGVTWLHVSTLVENVGNRALSLDDGFVRIQQVLPLDGRMSERLESTGTVLEKDKPRVDWPTLKKIVHNEPIKIEPGEREIVNNEFAIPSSVNTVKIYSYYENSSTAPGFLSWSGNIEAIGWSKTTIYDIHADGSVEGGHGGVSISP